MKELIKASINLFGGTYALLIPATSVLVSLGDGFDIEERPDDLLVIGNNGTVVLINIEQGAIKSVII